jgi:hypothetical protein
MVRKALGSRLGPRGFTGRTGARGATGARGPKGETGESGVVPTSLDHYNPLLVTVLPKERRAKHPYQLCTMAMLFSLGLWQMTVGAVPAASVNLLDESAYRLLNIVCILGGAAGIVAAWIPERIVQFHMRLYRWAVSTEFDATYFRLWEELGAHVLLFSVWFSYGQTVWVNFGLVKGYSFGLAAAIWSGVAALWRVVEIWLTLYRARTFSRQPSAIVGEGTILDDEAEA